MREPTSVLVVEDEAIVAQDLKETLEELGYQVTGLAATSDEALRSVAERTPDLVLMDIRIRGAHDGIVTAGFLRQRFAVPVIYLTANTDEVTRRRAFESEPCGYLRKPVQPADLHTAIELAVYRWRRTHQRREHARVENEALRAIGDAVVAVDRDGQVTYMNAAAEALTGVTAGEARGRRLTDIIERPDPLRRTTPLQVVLEGRAARHAAEVAVAQAEQPPRIVSEEAFAVRGEAGIEGAVLVLRDVTSERATRQQAELAQRLASLSTLAAGVAHGVNTPLSVILANAAFIGGELLPGAGDLVLPAGTVAAVREAATELEAAARAIATIIADLRAFSRVTPLAGEEADVASALGAAMRATPQLATRAHVDVALPPGLRVRMDGRRLADVLSQLLANAADAIVPGHPDRNAVRIAGAAHGAEVVLEVQDTGVGIAPEVLGRIFDPFFTTKDIGAGTGLGLAMCHGAVVAAGGHIEVESAPGRGTTFRVRLPGQVAAPAAAPVEIAPAAPLRGRVLVVDDEPLILRAMQRVLKDHELVCLEQPEVALARIAAGERFDVILSDLMMPGLTGMDLHERVRALAPALARRIVFITGGAVQPDVAEFLATTDNPWREKPLPPDELRALVQERLRALGPWPGR